MIDWSLAPEGAIELRMIIGGGCARWFNGDGNYFSGSSWLEPTAEYVTISTRPTEPHPQKTVADAWEWSKGERLPDDYAGVSYSESRQDFSFYKYNSLVEKGKSEFYIKLCTREEFEAYGREQEAKQEGEKWTHEYGSASIKCKVLAIDGDESWVFTEYGNKVTEFTDSLRPIKPTITKAEAWDKATSQDVESSMSVGAILDEYEVK
jgi:hypothetical protein